MFTYLVCDNCSALNSQNIWVHFFVFCFFVFVLVYKSRICFVVRSFLAVLLPFLLLWQRNGLKIAMENWKSIIIQILLWLSTEYQNCLILLYITSSRLFRPSMPFGRASFRGVGDGCGIPSPLCDSLSSTASIAGNRSACL